MKRIKSMEEINADIVLLDSEDKQIIEEIVKYEEEVFGEGAIGIWNIKPFIKYFFLIFDNFLYYLFILRI